MSEKMKEYAIIYIIVSFITLTKLYDVKIENDSYRNGSIYASNNYEYLLFESSIVKYHDILVQLCHSASFGDYDESMTLYEDIMKASPPLDYYKKINPDFIMNIREMNDLIFDNMRSNKGDLFAEILVLESIYPDAFDKRSFNKKYLLADKDDKIKHSDAYIDYSNDFNSIVDRYKEGDDNV